MIRFVNGYILSGFFMLCLSGVFVNNAVATTATFTINSTDTVLELTVPSIVSLNLTPSTNGTAFDTAEIDIGVGTNNPTGYTLTMTTDSTNLTRTSSITDGNNTVITPTIPSITSTYSEALFESSNDTINKWGYKKSTESNYYAITASTTIPLKATEGPSNATGSEVVLNLAAKVDTSLPAGTYATTFNFSAVTNYVPPVIADLTYMQDFASLSSSDKTSVLASMATRDPSSNVEGIYTLIDKRDNTTYRIAKLADGNVWLLDNLALDLTTLTQAELYGTGDDAGKMTNASNTTLGYLKNGGGSSPYTGTAVALATTTNSFDVPYIAKNGTCYNAYCVDSPSSGNWSYDVSTTATINNVTSRVQGKVGIYYNYCAASAGSYCYISGGSTGDASEDICPYGWHLPTGDTAQGSFYYLYNTGYSAGYNNFVDALSTPLSGSFASGKARNQGYYGYFWSSTWSSNTSMYSLNVSSSRVFPQLSYARDYVYSVRCLAK